MATGGAGRKGMRLPGLSEQPGRQDVRGQPSEEGSGRTGQAANQASTPSTTMMKRWNETEAVTDQLHFVYRTGRKGVKMISTDVWLIHRHRARVHFVFCWSGAEEMRSP